MLVEWQPPTEQTNCEKVFYFLPAIKFSIKKRFSPLNHSEKGERKTMMKKMRNETNKKGANAAERYMLCCAVLLT